MCLLFLVGVLCVRGLRFCLFGTCFAMFMCHVGPKYTEAIAVMACCVCGPLLLRVFSRLQYVKLAGAQSPLWLLCATKLCTRAADRLITYPYLQSKEFHFPVLWCAVMYSLGNTTEKRNEPLVQMKRYPEPQVKDFMSLGHRALLDR